MTKREYEDLYPWIKSGQRADELVDPLLIRKGYIERVGPDRYVLTERGKAHMARREPK